MTTLSSGVTAHSGLTGLTGSDDHTQYAVVAPGSSTRNVLQPSDASYVPLTLKGASSQAGNLLSLQTSAGTVQGSFDPNGRLLINPSAWSSSTPLLQITKAASDPQNGHYPAYIDCKNSASTSLFTVNWQGIVLAAGMNASGVGFDLTIGNGGNFRVRDAASATLAQFTHNAGGYVTNAGTKRIEWNATGIGFFAATPVAKQTITGSRGGNAALAALLTGLASLGLITDSTSA